MVKRIKRSTVIFVSFILLFSGMFAFDGMIDSPSWAESGGADDSGENAYSKDGGVLESLGFDTSQMPEAYDPDDTDNPYGSDVATLCEMNELVRIDTTDNKNSRLYGHDGLLNGSYDALNDKDKEIAVTIGGAPGSGPGEHAFVAGTDLDVTGNGRDDAAAIVYSNYRYNSDESMVEAPEIYMEIYNPKTGRSTGAFELSSFIGNKVEDGYVAQSQMQIAAGDFDNDTVDEVAVYVPASTEETNPRVAIFDLSGGKDCADPYQKGAWKNVWNYVLPKCHGVVPGARFQFSVPYYIPNFYNNIDLTAGDADNDGSCDLVVSYGASSVRGGFKTDEHKQAVRTSLPSRSVLLYGSNGDSSHGGQMLRDTEELDYGGDELIRVSIAFGDLTGDGNEEMILGGQLRSEQEDNTSRVLGKYIYDPEARDMVPETVQNLDVVSGSWHENPTTKEQEFSSANGWDGHYYSVPAMKTNLAVGDIMGQDSRTKIYMDSVLYSYGNSFSIEDQMEDTSPEDPNDPNKGTKGSAVFTDIKGEGIYYKDLQMEYYEYGASMANYTMSRSDYLVVHRVVPDVKGTPLSIRVCSDAAILVPEEDDDGIRLTKDSADHNYNRYSQDTDGAPVTMFTADTDIDSSVAIYTGKHEIDYKDPRILAVLASAPYFKDVADYDGGHMLDFCTTTYGKSESEGDGYSSSIQINAGAYTNNTISFGAGAMGSYSLVGVNVNSQAGFQYTRESSMAMNRRFEVTYGSTAGENEVVFFSTPTENYTYLVSAGAVDSEGNVTPAFQTQINPIPHNPVAQTMSVDDYMQIQQRYKNKLPDVTKYLTSTPGDPASYPSGPNDIPKAVDESWKDVYWRPMGMGEIDHMTGDDAPNAYQMGIGPVKRKEYVSYQPDAWEGAGFGNGYITQTISQDIEYNKQVGYGGYFSFEIGLHFEEHAGTGVVVGASGDHGLHFDVGGAEGVTYMQDRGISCSGTVTNMPASAKGYGYDYSWSLLKYLVHESDECVFPVVTYMTSDVKSPPKLPNSITQDFDKTTDSEIGLVWDYSDNAPVAFDVYRYRDFPQGGGDELVGSVKGSEYTIRKDSKGNTITDAKGRPIREYSFVEDGLTADTKYNYRIKVRGNSRPTESIFSPIVQARTDVSVKPELSLSTDELTIYADEEYHLSVELKDPENYESKINYQWQKYSTKEHKWQDLKNNTDKTLDFVNCKSSQAGEYRCRVNLVRKKESSPQYISAFTGVCKVNFDLRDVIFGPISIFSGEGSSNVPTHTGISVKVSNANSTGAARPTGKVYFTLTGPNGDITVYSRIDEETGTARINSLEDLIGTMSQQTLVNGGYVITAEYLGDSIFRPAKDPEEYHYLRNIDECIWLSTQSGYAFGRDIMPTTNLYDYRKESDGSVLRTDITDQIKTVKMYAVDKDNNKTGEAIAVYDLTETEGVARIPLNEKLKKKALIEAYTAEDEVKPVASHVVGTLPMDVEISLLGKTSGQGDLFKPYSFKTDEGEDPDVYVSGGCSMTEKNMISAEGGEPKSLEDLLMFRYYQDNGDEMFTSVDMDNADDPKKYIDRFIPARYRVDLAARDKNAKKLYETFYDFQPPQKTSFLVVSSYYEVTGKSADEGMGSVRMISPILMDSIEKVGFSGGSRITLKAYPSNGFRIKGWKVEYDTGDAQYQTGGDLLVHTLRNDTTGNNNGQVNITAIFEPKNNTLTYGAKGKGQLSVNPDFASGNTILEGTRLQFTARADEGWHFKEWRWENYGGSNSISQGTPVETGVNSKTYTMGDKPAAVYAIFMRDTIDLDLGGDLTASYVNKGENPLEETDKIIYVEKGRGVPKGTKVRVQPAPGFVLAEGARWNVTVTTKEGTSPVEVEEYTAGGTEGCTFELPDDVIGCSVKTTTQKGRYSIGLGGTAVKYEVELDDTKISEDQYDDKLQHVPAGTRVVIRAVPVRGKLFEDWILDGERQKSSNDTCSFTLTESVNLAAVVKDDIPYKVTVKAEGGGRGLLTITGHDGESIPAEFGADSVEVTAYEGETISIAETPEVTDHIMTAVTMNGERQDLVNGTFTLNELTGNAEFVCRFKPITYGIVSFRSEFSSAKILDAAGRPIEAGETFEVGKEETLEFTVVVGKNSPQSKVTTDEGTLKLKEKIEGDAETTYRYELSEVSRNAVITIDDRFDYEIGNWQEFADFMNKLNQINDSGSAERPQAVLTADITMPDNAEPILCSGTFNGILDGRGHRISGLRLGTERAPYDGRPTLFGNIAAGGAVKNLIIDGFEAYYEFADSDTQGVAIVTGTNEGSLSGITLKDCLLYSTAEHDLALPEEVPIQAGLAASNKGSIRACQIIGLKLHADRYHPAKNTTGSAAAIRTDEGSEVVGCYVEGLKYRRTPNHEYIDTEQGILCLEIAGTCKGNYFRLSKDVLGNITDDGGTDVKTIAVDQESTEKIQEELNSPFFAANLAWHINKDVGMLWGVQQLNETPNEEDADEDGMITPLILPLDMGNPDVKAPVRVRFGSGDTEKIMYLYPDFYRMPGEEIFGDDTPEYWVCDDLAYSAGCSPVMLDRDASFTGAAGLDKCVAKMTIPQQGTICYRNLPDALYDLENLRAGDAQEGVELDIVGSCRMENISFTLDQGIKMTICDGGRLEMMKTADFHNKGEFNCASGGILEKYSHMVNEGVIKVDGTFNNYGSKLKNTGRIENQEDIKCNPHCRGPWQASAQPNPDGTWDRSSMCEVCTNVVTKKVDPDPVADKIGSIEIFRKPYKTQYKVGEAFSNDGMIVAANLKEGGKALITDYEMIIDEKKPRTIRKGDVLKESGTKTITVKAKGFACKFSIQVAAPTPKPTPKKPQTVGKTIIRNTIANTIANPKYMDVIYDAVPGATGYDIAYKHKNSNKWVVKSVGKTTRARINGFSVNGLYHIKVRAKKSETSAKKAATGAWSPTIYRYFYTTQKIRLASKSKGSFTMSWAKDTQATGYQVMFTTNKNGAGAAKNINTVGKDATSFTKKGLKSGKTYYVQVRELKKVGSDTYIGNISKPVPVRIK